MSKEYSQLNNGFGPIFDERQNRERHVMIAIFFLILLMVVPSYLDIDLFLHRKSFSEDLVLLCMIISSLTVGEFLRRLTFLYEEIFHLKKRYKGSFKSALYNCIAVSNSFGVIFIIFIVTFAVSVNHWKNSKKEIVSFTVYVAYAICSSIGMHLLNLKELSPVEYSHLNEIENKHLAAGLAWGYYFGYLKDQLPKLKFLVEAAVAPYSVIEGVDARDHLEPIMYIIIPKDCNCMESLEKCDDRIKFQYNSLEDKRNTGGVHERSYKNSVYSVKLNDSVETKYIIMEYATPVRNLYRMAQHSKADLTEEDLEREVIMFYKTLKSILEDDRECFGHYKLVLLSGTLAQKNNLVDILYRAIDDDEILVE